jgi:hypothetical protein
MLILRIADSRQPIADEMIGNQSKLLDPLDKTSWTSNYRLLAIGYPQDELLILWDGRIDLFRPGSNSAL